MKKLCYLILIIIFCFNSLSAEEKLSNGKKSVDKTRYGLFGGINLNLHTSDFQKLPGIPSCCPTYSSGFGIGPALGVLYEIPLAESLKYGLRLGYYDLSAGLVDSEKKVVMYKDEPYDGNIEHTMDGTISVLGLENIAIYNLFGDLSVSAGFRIDYALTTDFAQAETIVDPAGGAVFKDTDKSTRNVISGEIPDASSIFFSGQIGFSYELPMNKSNTMFLVPEVSYAMCFTDVAKDINWKPNALFVGAAVKFVPSEKIKTIRNSNPLNIDTVRVEVSRLATETFSEGGLIISCDTLYFDNSIEITENVNRTDTVFVNKAAKITAELNMKGVGMNGEIIDSPQFKIEEFISGKVQPLLNYIFFDTGSDKIPGRYKRISSTEASKFETDDLYNTATLPTYYHILNIIAKRMQGNNSKLTITGCNNGIGAEKNNKTLSMNRAKAVRQYLLDVWKLDPSRLIIKARNLPKKNSTPVKEPFKAAENARVELVSSLYDVTKPVMTADTLRVSNPPTARFLPTAISDADIQDWNIKVYQNSGKIINLDASGTAELTKEIDWEIVADPNKVPREGFSAQYSISVRNVDGSEAVSKPKEMNIEILTLNTKRENKIDDKIIDKYSLILFDFDKSSISGANKTIIKFIQNRISPESTVIIEGFTDQTGDAAHNIQLSEKRAKAAKNALNAKNVSAVGIGEGKLLYNNSLPEGRFYCRTVNITVETPINK